MRIRISALAFFSLLAGAGVAFAEDSPDCGDAALSQWMTKDAIKAKFASGGTDVRQVKIEGSCYEVYAVTKDGKKVEHVVNPVTGQVVGSEDDQG